MIDAHLTLDHSRNRKTSHGQVQNADTESAKSNANEKISYDQAFLATKTGKLYLKFEGMFISPPFSP